MQSSSIMGDSLKILYEDNHLIAVFKPHRILSQGDQTGDLSIFEATKAWLKERDQKPGNVFLGLIHRLDRPVAGVLLFAKTSKGASRLSEQIRQRSFKKTYLAWVEGDLKGGIRRLDQLLVFDDTVKKARVVDPSEPGVASTAKQGVLEYELVKSHSGKSLLKINLETGRKHQIRAQLAFLGHPILGDHKYGAKQDYEQGAIALVASEIVFSKATLDESVVVKADLSLLPQSQLWRPL